MKTIGQYIAEKRKQQNKTIQEVADDLQVRSEFIANLENDQYHILPPLVYVKGFLKRFSDYANLDKEQTLALFRRSYDKKPQNKSAPPQPISRAFFSITPNMVIGGIISIVIIGFLAFLFWQYRSYTGKPVLVVQSPKDQSVLYQDYVEVIGQTDPEAVITINGQNAEVSKDGSFAVAIGLDPGFNTLTIVAKSKAGKETIIQKEVEVVESTTPTP